MGLAFKKDKIEKRIQLGLPIPLRSIGSRLRRALGPHSDCAHSTSKEYDNEKCHSSNCNFTGVGRNAI
ncbi:hypothetical protein D1BOALGB6SA_8979 [Olavius sp. associated proteobacterium Delta 1]|nr:hypothetical protein D1BOALGB6SA_8979 [Olavius sp. associated proteobacterium Delta 1]